MRNHHLKFLFSISFILLFVCVSQSLAQGVMFRGAGAVNQSMGGAATAAPLSAGGALYWNPATMSQFYGTSIDIDLGIAMPESSISSTLPAAYGGVGGGTTESDTGAIPIPNVAIVRRQEDSPVAVGFSFGATGGAKTNYESAPWYSNPILSSGPVAQLGGAEVGYGNLSSSVQILQLGGHMSYSLTEKLSFSFSPILTIGEIACDPLYLVEGHQTPDTAIHSPGGRYVWGAGFMVGMFYDTQCGWRFGLSYKSQNWIEPIEFNTTYGKQTLKLDLPAVLSLGLSYDGFERWLFACDFRYYFHEDAGFDQVGWSDMFAMSLGAQYQLTERVALRVGYSMNENQLDSLFSRACIAVPLIPQHALFVGGSYRFDEHMVFHLTYGHVFKATASGPFGGPAAAALGGDVTIAAEADELAAGVTFNF